MNMHGLLNNAEFVWAGALVANASNTDSNSTRIDMSDAESVLFVTTIDDSAATGVATLKIEENDDDSDTGMTAVTGLTVSKTCAVNDDINNTLLIVEYSNPNKRYVQGVRVSATANIAFGPIIAIKRKRIVPVTQGATVSGSKVLAG